MKKMTLREALESLQEYEFMAGPGMGAGDGTVARPDTSGVRMRGRKDNFVPITDKGEDWPYDDYGEGGPANAQGAGARGVGRGGVGWGGRPDVSGKARSPSAVYDKTWDTTDEGADWEELQRHGDDKYRNVWRDTPDGEHWSEMNNEAMGSPTNIGPLTAMDGPQHNVLQFSSGGIDDMLAKDDNRGPAGQWGGPGTVPGQSRGWAASPTLGGEPDDVWKVPEKEEEGMKLREFFDPSPVPVEEIDNPEQDHFKDQSDEEIEGEVDRIETLKGDEEDEPGFGDQDDGSFSDRMNPADMFILPKMGAGGEFVMTPDKFGAARGTYGIHTDAKMHNDLVAKGTAWDVLQRVIDAMSSQDPDGTGEED